MKVIFVKSISNIAAAGEIKDVSFGYAVNYLIPRGFAVKATEKEIQRIKNRKAEIIKEKENKQIDDQKKADSFKNKEFIIKVKAGKKGKLYGAVTRKDIAKKIGVDKQSVLLVVQIKKTGEYNIELKFGQKRTPIKLIIKEADINEKR